MENKEIIKKIEEWFNDENVMNGRPECLIENCDLCINCLDKLLKKFGGSFEDIEFIIYKP